ncbi:MAG: ATP-binding protein [Candidatus Omnitrophica bacterium]|nr:ATP-binding protein [Candidatus Omnitrophota bacterium]
MENKEVVHLKLPAHFSYVPTARACVREAAKKAGLPEDDVDKIVLAADEAAVNVIKHAFLPEEAALFDVICEASSIIFKVIVKDKGYPFSPGDVEEYSIDRVIKEGKTTGLGVYLMKHSVDELSFHNNGFGGKEVHLVKYIHQKHIDKCIDKSEIKPYKNPVGPKKKPIEKADYRVELLNPEKSIEVSQCAYRTYGYNYIHEFIYYPERIAEMNRKKELISGVAVSDKTSEIVSHATLEVFKGKNAVELGAAFTKPNFRRQGCFNRICEYLINEAKKEGIKGLYATAVTIHPFSQKVILKNNFKECGIMIGMAQASMFRDSLEHGQQRESMVVLFRDINQDLNKSLYAPGHHKAVLVDIYSNIGVPVEWKEQAEPVVSREYSVIETEIHGPMSTGYIHIKEYGSDIKEKIRHSLKELVHNKIEAVFLYLDLCDPLTMKFAKDFEEMGFFFSGILPSGSRQNLVLQYLNDIRIDYSKICVASLFTSRLLSYIKSQDPNQRA